MKYIIGNWKMNPKNSEAALKLASAVDKKGAIICPPFVYLEEIAKTLKEAELGAQDVFWEEEGAFTGEISLNQLKEFKVKYIIIGHSERRALGETDAMVARKLRACHQHNFIPILCIGESKEAKDEDRTKDILKDQIEKALFQLDKEKEIIIAYEPIWAIGSDSPAKPEEVVELASYILEIAKPLSDNVRVIYGGSTNASNCSSYLELKSITGLLPGGASLKPEEFNKMLEIASTK